MKTVFVKKNLALVLAVLMCVSLILTSCGTAEDGTVYETKNVTVSSESMGLSVDTVVSNDFPRYASLDLAEEDAELRQFCFVTLMDAHDIGVANVVTEAAADGETAEDKNTDETNDIAFPTALGLENVKEYVVGEGAATDENDRVLAVISMKKLSSKPSEYFVNVSLCGTANADEWASDFDVGADTADYPGEHPEWTDKTNHKGFDVTANRVVAQLKEYLGECGVESGKVTVILSGYSRGAAVSNLVAAKLIDDGTALGETLTLNVGAYTFATPQTTTNSDAQNEKYNRIHNYVSTDDVVTAVPSTTMGFRRFGTDTAFSVQENEALKAEYDSLAEKPYDTACAQDVMDAVGALLSDRGALYAPAEDDEHSYFFGISCGDREEDIASAEAQIEAKKTEVENTFKTLGLDKYIRSTEIECLDEETEDGVTHTYTWRCYVSDSVLLGAFANAITAIEDGNLLSVLSTVSCLVNYTRHTSNVSVISSAIFGNSTFLQQAHFPLAYYLACIKNAD